MKKLMEKYHINIKKLITMMVELVVVPFIYILLFEKTTAPLLKDYLSNFTFENCDGSILKFFVFKNPAVVDVHFVMSLVVIMFNLVWTCGLILTYIFIVFVTATFLKDENVASKKIRYENKNITKVDGIYLLNQRLLC